MRRDCYFWKQFTTNYMTIVVIKVNMHSVVIKGNMYFVVIKGKCVFSDN